MWQSLVRGVVRPLESRKVRVAVATVLAAYAAEHGLGWNEELVLTVVSVGVALILGVAHEDAGRNAAGTSGDATKSTAQQSSGTR